MQNQPSENHDRIINLMKNNIHQIMKRSNGIHHFHIDGVVPCNLKALLDNHAGMVLPVRLVESVVSGQDFPFYI